MKAKRVAALVLAGCTALSLMACSSSNSSDSGSKASSDSSDSSSDSTGTAFKDIKYGETGTDITASIKLLTNRTDMLEDDYAGPKTYQDYIDDFNKTYPNIKVEVEGLTDYANDSLTRLQGGDWGDIMMIPDVAASDLSTYFYSYGSYDDLKDQYNYIDKNMADNEVYGMPSEGTGTGVLYNKKVFEEAGITETSTTPDEFLDALQKIKDHFGDDVIPLYTNYAAGWTLTQADGCIGLDVTGDPKYRNQTMLHTKDIFSDPGDGTGIYQIHKIYYDAVANGLTEDDYTTTDWESSKGMLNNGQIGCMFLGTWAVPQMQQGGSNPDDIGFMAFPVSVDGKQYMATASDYTFGINADDSGDQLLASELFVKYMVDESGFYANEGGLPVKVDDPMPDFAQSLTDAGVILGENEPAVSGEEDRFSELNSESNLQIQGDGTRIQKLIEEAASGGETLDELTDEWNQAWDDALDSVGE